MGLFDDILKSGESLFLNEVALDYSFVPKLMPYRENEQRRVASCIKPLFQGISGRNLFIFGAPGIGKTAGIKWVFRDLEEETDEIVPIYINCWHKNTSHKIITEICEATGYKFTQNKKTDELMGILAKRLNQNKGNVFCFDEVDKVENLDFLYFLIEEIYKKSIILITNYKEWMGNVDERIKSRLNAEGLEFRQYNKKETEGILRQRIKYAFVDGVWDEEAFQKVVGKAYELRDIRSGLYLMREAGLSAEERSSRKIEVGDVEKALGKFEDFSIKKKEELEDDTKLILGCLKGKGSIKSGELFRHYQEKGGKLSYKSFQRKVGVLEKGGFVKVEKVIGGAEGTTSIISMANKSLSEY